MLSFESDTSRDIGMIRMKASGTITRDDVQRFIPEFERVARSKGPVRMMIELEDFQGWNFGGLWEDLKFDMQHQSDMGRIAIVGDKRWQDLGTRLSKPFFKAEMRYFDRNELEQAESWLSRL
jgi:hypothetical protein